MLQWAWRMSTRGFLKQSEPIAISTMWRLPWQLDVIDAIFERPGDGVVVIFRGPHNSFSLSLLTGYSIKSNP